MGKGRSRNVIRSIPLRVFQNWELLSPALERWQQHSLYSWILLRSQVKLELKAERLLLTIRKARKPRHSRCVYTLAANPSCFHNQNVVRSPHPIDTPRNICLLVCKGRHWEHPTFVKTLSKKSETLMLLSSRKVYLQKWDAPIVKLAYEQSPLQEFAFSRLVTFPVIRSIVSSVQPPSAFLIRRRKRPSSSCF